MLDSSRLQAEGAARQIRSLAVKPVRGNIFDRNGDILAVSTPLDALWGHPPTLLQSKEDLPRLAKALDISIDRLSDLINRNIKREFVYLRRHLPPADAAKIENLGIPGVSSLREYGRYYPAGPITSHVLGFTDVDDRGQEGIERAFENHLSGVEGRKLVLRDRKGRAVEDIESIRPVHHGRDLQLSLDLRIQASAIRHLTRTVRDTRAVSASAVMLKTGTGEVLAMVNLPIFNPNNRSDIVGNKFRNRSVTDVLEPGSTIKPFTLLLALASERFSLDSKVSTSPGVYYVGGHPIRDIKDYGDITLSKALIKSSNIGTAKIALKLSPEEIHETLSEVGFGQSTGIELPGEEDGSLIKRNKWRPIEHATLSFGYGISSTQVQLARAYGVLASGGILRPVTITRKNQFVKGKRVLPEHIVRQINALLEQVVAPEGTAQKAAIPGYRVAGKTGTVHKVKITGGYEDDKYQSLFVGFAPASSPQFVLAIMIDEPKDKHFGGDVAAPVFSKIMSDALRLYGIRPDANVGKSFSLNDDESKSGAGA